MPHQTEPNVNNALAYLLQPILSSCDVRSENTQVIVGRPSLRPDILITAPGRSPVVVEAEYMPAASVEREAKCRLGLKVSGASRPIEATVSLRYPEDVGDADDLRTALQGTQLSYNVFTATQPGKVDRFPETGWLEGSVEDLADLLRLVSVPQRAVHAAAASMEQGIERVAAILDEVDKSRSSVTTVVARLLGMTNVPQTRRMACAIIANAMVFHERIAGMHDNIKSLRLTCGPEVANPHSETLDAWSRILEINYWPIFAVGRDILAQLPSGDATRILRTLEYTAGEVAATGIDNAHDLTGRVFQRLIADRKYLATFYTLPASAALLARLAVAKMGVDWSNADSIGKLRVGDFACGTGALLSAVYEQVASRHESAGGNAAALHKVMMEEVLYGCDVMPSAVHITGSTLAGTEPSVDFGNSRLYTMPYGRQADGTVAVGSLELLQSSSALTLFNTSDPARRTGSVGEETASQVMVDIPHEGFDLVIMNPPFTSNTAKEAGHIGVFAPAFAAFESNDKDQRDMAKRLSGIKTGTCYHGHAGMASAFAALAHRKLKPGGVLALVLPLTASVASSWQGFRRMIGEGYSDLTVLSIAASGNDMSFSSDTGMAECLIIGRKVTHGDTTRSRVNFVTLSHRPSGFVHASMLAQSILNAGCTRGIEDGPYGGTPLKIGDQISGEMLTASHIVTGEPLAAVRLSDYSLAQTAHALTQSKLWLPARNPPLQMKVCSLGDLGSLGLYDLDITGRPPQGSFTRMPYHATATYPSLWNHNARKETRIICVPDTQLQVRPGMEPKAEAVWATASRCHLNRDFTFGSQALAVAFTDQESIGGRVWPNVIFDDTRLDYAFTVWSNSTLGLLSHWWHSSRQQSSKASMSIRSADSLPVLDFRALTDEQLHAAEVFFEEFRDKELKPAYLADADRNRALLDRWVVCDLLGFDEKTYMAVRHMAAKWCAEPSVHGGKPRPKGAELVF